MLSAHHYMRLTFRLGRAWAILSAGDSCPVHGAIPEHMAVREAAGLFDVSHMGEIEVTGAGALALGSAPNYQ